MLVNIRRKRVISALQLVEADMANHFRNAALLHMDAYLLDSRQLKRFKRKCKKVNK